MVKMMLKNLGIIVANTLTDSIKMIDIDSDFSKNDTAEPDEPTTKSTFADFIHEHYFDLESIFTSYISMTDNPDETEFLEKFQKLFYQTKEAERNKVCFKP